MTKLTVTIPSYKQPAQLSRLLKALSLQTFKDFNVIIIDDASGVDLIQLIEPYTNNLSISILKNQNNLGAMANMQKSITLETDSPYIFSHHEDDYIKSNYLEEAIKILDNSPHISFVLTAPEWVEKDATYESVSLLDPTSTVFNGGEFMEASLRRIPFIFGSVIYRKKDIVGSFDLSTYHTLCDKIFLTEILLHSQTSCSFIKAPGIYVRDHSLDEQDNRSRGATINHLINYFLFYKKHMPDSSHKRALISNGLLLSYANLDGPKQFGQLYREQRRYNLISLSRIDRAGIYALISILLGKTISHEIMKLLRLTKK